MLHDICTLLQVLLLISGSRGKAVMELRQKIPLLCTDCLSVAESLGLYLHPPRRLIGRLT